MWRRITSRSCSGYMEVYVLQRRSTAILAEPRLLSLGAFVEGSNAQLAPFFELHATITDIGSRLPGENVVARSVELGHPVVYVSPNYRLNGMGPILWFSVSSGSRLTSVWVLAWEGDEGSRPHESRLA